MEYGICDLISNDYDEILSHFNISYTSIVEVEESLELKAAKFLSGSFISTLLLTLICRSGGGIVYTRFLV